MVRSGTRKTFLDCLGHRIKADGHNELALRETTSFRRTSPEGSEILAESQRHERKVNRTLAQIVVRTVRVPASELASDLDLSTTIVFSRMIIPDGIFNFYRKSNEKVVALCSAGSGLFLQVRSCCAFAPGNIFLVMSRLR
ncbi:MAG: hypothetical protein QOI53_3334 [Verrucomicrobiota bacterium]|nr:hypothetical protein [Verrucomicrobiota bacterium]